MKTIITRIFISLFLPAVALAEDLNCEMGGMDVDSYGLFIAFLGLFCGIAFVLGINQGLGK